MAKRSPTQNEFLEDARAEIPSDISLGEISRLAEQQIELEDRIKELEEEVRTTKQKLARISADVLPTAMSNLNLSEFKLSDGTEIKIAPFVSTHISEVNKQAAYLWLAENGYGDLVKDQVVLTFGRQEHDIAMKALEVLRREGYSPENKQSVHGNTLRAWAKERLALGQEIPMDLFGVYAGQITKITRKKGD